jgi:hypothetical protein
MSHEKFLYGNYLRKFSIEIGNSFRTFEKPTWYSLKFEMSYCHCRSQLSFDKFFLV